MKTSSPAIEFLVVDDDARLAKGLAGHLQAKRHTSVTIADGRGTLAWLQNNRCEVVIVGLNMPNIGDVSLISHIRNMDRTLPIIVFTGLGYDEDQMHAALRAGAIGYVSKNLPVEQLYAVLSRVLGTTRYRARRARGRATLLGVA